MKTPDFNLPSFDKETSSYRSRVSQAQDQMPKMADASSVAAPTFMRDLSRPNAPVEEQFVPGSYVMPTPRLERTDPAYDISPGAQQAMRRTITPFEESRLLNHGRHRAGNASTADLQQHNFDINAAHQGVSVGSIIPISDIVRPRAAGYERAVSRLNRATGDPDAGVVRMPEGSQHSETDVLNAFDSLRREQPSHRAVESIRKTHGDDAAKFIEEGIRRGLILADAGGGQLDPGQA